MEYGNKKIIIPLAIVAILTLTVVFSLAKKLAREGNDGKNKTPIEEIQKINVMTEEEIKADLQKKDESAVQSGINTSPDNTSSDPIEQDIPKIVPEKERAPVPDKEIQDLLNLKNAK